MNAVIDKSAEVMNMNRLSQAPMLATWVYVGGFFFTIGDNFFSLLAPVNFPDKRPYVFYVFSNQ